jgi:hypothetical protein
MLSKYQVSAQEVLDQLFQDALIPFKIEAHKVTDEGSREYRIHFYDSRIHSVVVDARSSTPIKQQISAAVLLRMKIRAGEFSRAVAAEKSILFARPWPAISSRQAKARAIGTGAKLLLA